MHALDVPEQDPRVGVTLVFAAAALVLALSTPQIAEAPTGPLVAGPSAFVERVLDWRPQSPPPWGDADQAAAEDTDAVAGRSAADRDRRSSTAIRTRPQR